MPARKPRRRAGERIERVAGARGLVVSAVAMSARSSTGDAHGQGVPHQGARGRRAGPRLPPDRRAVDERPPSHPSKEAPDKDVHRIVIPDRRFDGLGRRPAQPCVDRVRTGAGRPAHASGGCRGRSRRRRRHHSGVPTCNSVLGHKIVLLVVGQRVRRSLRGYNSPTNTMPTTDRSTTAPRRWPVLLHHVAGLGHQLVEHPRVARGGAR
jgi:hypothetical protein